MAETRLEKAERYVVAIEILITRQRMLIEELEDREQAKAVEIATRTLKALHRTLEAHHRSRALAQEE
jgi:hypothetical protein